MDNTTQAPLQGAQFEDTTITIDGFEGGSTWPGKKLGNTGLGYWIAEPEDEDDTEPTFYAPTHIPSGYRLSPTGPFYSEEICQQYIRALASMLDWNRPIEELTLDPKYSPLQFIEICRQHIFEDAANTAGGGAW